MAKNIENEIVEPKKTRRRSKKSTTKEANVAEAVDVVKDSTTDEVVSEVVVDEVNTESQPVSEALDESTSIEVVEINNVETENSQTSASEIEAAPEEGALEETVTIDISAPHKYVAGECIEAPFGFRLYSSSSAEIPRGRINGKFYVWDSTVYGDRIRLTDSPSGVGKLGRAIGWANVCELDRYVK